MAYGTMSIGNAGFTKKFISVLFLLMHPKGALFGSDDPTSPAELYGGTWERIEDCTIWGASDTHPAGTTVEAGLPEIYSQINDVLFSSSDPFMTGDSLKTLFTGIPNGYVSASGTSNVYRSNVQLKASLGNSIYGTSNTVQPPAYCMYIWRRVA